MLTNRTAFLPPSLREVDSPKAKTEGVSCQTKQHSPSHDLRRASPLNEGAKALYGSQHSPKKADDQNVSPVPVLK